MKYNQSNIKKAKKYLDNNDCIGVPTETVYGLAANAYSNKAIKKIFRELKKKDKNWKFKKIKARFICSLSLSYLDKKIACVTGKVEGKISSRPLGKNGFGYDPIFIPLNKKQTFGEMKSAQKYRIDHRYKAFKKIKKFL